MFAVGNNLNRAHNYFQDFWKRFSISFKAQQLQFNRKQKQIKKKKEREKPTWALPGAAHQAHLPAQPSHRASEQLGSARQAGRCSPAAPARATQLAAALLPPLAALLA